MDQFTENTNTEVTDYTPRAHRIFGDLSQDAEPIVNEIKLYGAKLWDLFDAVQSTGSYTDLNNGIIETSKNEVLAAVAEMIRITRIVNH